MGSLLEIIATLVGTVLVLALAAQALQEMVKHTFAIKGWTRFQAVERLVVESARQAGLGTTDGKNIMEQVAERLRGLSQNGLRPGTVRLDVLDQQQLSQLIRSVDPARVCALKPLGQEDGRRRLGDVADETVKWFDLSLAPVADRYRRRMQLGALASALVVVLAVNADAIRLAGAVRTDPSVRSRMAAAAQASWTADSALRVLEDSALALARDSATAAAAASLGPAIQVARTRRDSLLTATLTGDQSAFLGYPADWQFGWTWLIGIVFSTLLVSLGAPFWHDVLEAVFGLKHRMRPGGTAPEERKPEDGASRNGLLVRLEPGRVLSRPAVPGPADTVTRN